MAPVGLEPGRAPEQIWTLLRREKSLDPAENRTTAIQHVPRRYTDCGIPDPEKPTVLALYDIQTTKIYFENIFFALKISILQLMLSTESGVILLS